MSTSLLTKFWRKLNCGKMPPNIKMTFMFCPNILMKWLRRLHLDHVGAKLTKLNQKQADYIGVDSAGPFKPSHYRY